MEIYQLAQQLQLNDDVVREYFSALAINAYGNFTQSGNEEHINKAIFLVRESIGLTNSDTFRLIYRLSNLGIFLLSRYKRGN